VSQSFPRTRESRPGPLRVAANQNAFCNLCRRISWIAQTVPAIIRYSASNVTKPFVQTNFRASSILQNTHAWTGQ